MNVTWATKFLRMMRHKPDTAAVATIIVVLLVISAFFIVFLKTNGF